MSVKQTLNKIKKSEKKVNFSTKIKASVKRDLDRICKTENATQSEILEAFVELYKQENG